MKIGIDLGGSHIAIGVLDDKSQIIEKLEKELVQKEKIHIKNLIETYIIENVQELSKKYEITKVGISVPGTIQNNIIKKCVNLGLENYNLVHNLQKKINLPIEMKNDAKCAAIAESKFGVLRDFKRGLFLTLGTGIGGAVIINEELLDTGDLPGCEFSHMVIEKDGIKCNCGKKGCFEKYGSMKAFKTNLKKELNLNEETRSYELLDIIRNNPKDEKINKVIDEFIEYLSIGISNLINIFEPEVIGIGGSFVYFSDILLDKLKANILDNSYLFNSREELNIMPAVLRNDAGIIGSCQ